MMNDPLFDWCIGWLWVRSSEIIHRVGTGYGNSTEVGIGQCWAACLVGNCGQPWSSVLRLEALCLPLSRGHQAWANWFPLAQLTKVFLMGQSADLLYTMRRTCTEGWAAVGWTAHVLLIQGWELVTRKEADRTEAMVRVHHQAVLTWPQPFLWALLTEQPVWSGQ